MKSIPKSDNVKDFYLCTYPSGRKVLIAFDGDIALFKSYYGDDFIFIEPFTFRNGEIVLTV